MNRHHHHRSHRIIIMKHHHQQHQHQLLLAPFKQRCITMMSLYIAFTIIGFLQQQQQQSSLILQQLPVVEGKIDRNAPHGHRGKLSPYKPGPFHGLTLTVDDETTLERGDSVMKQTIPTDGGSSGGTAICIQDVHAPITAVWAQILNMNEYPKKVNKVLKCENYHVASEVENHFTKIRIKTKQVLGVLPGYSYESYYDHTFYPEHSSLIWQLDYDKSSDMDDVSGHWHVMTHPKKGTQYSRVYYACDIRMKGHVPKPIYNYISQSALKQATTWVKRESELYPDRTVETELGGHQIPVVSSTTTKTMTEQIVDGETVPSRRRGWFGK